MTLFYMHYPHHFSPIFLSKFSHPCSQFCSPLLFEPAADLKSLSRVLAFWSLSIFLIKYLKYETRCLLTQLLTALSLVLATAVAADPDLLQDLCVANLSSGVKVNGFTCKDSSEVNALDFFSDIAAKPKATNNTFGLVVTGGNVQIIPGLNTLGVSMSRIDYAPGGLNPPHTHPRATEIVFVLEGQLDVGFITTANKLISKSINKGEIFVFPKGLVHFQKNNGNVPASVIAAFNSQLPGTQSIATTLFAASPPVPDHVLTQTFQVGTKMVEKIKSRLTPKK